MNTANPLYRIYERRLLRSLRGQQLPKHIGVILDGNRRWARELGEDASAGHKAGADRIKDLLVWCEEVGIELATLWMLSTDNLKRSPEELSALLEIIVDTVQNLGREPRWKIQMVGASHLLPENIVARLRAAADQPSDVDPKVHVNVAIGYGGRQEIVDAVKSYLHDALEAGRPLTEVADDFSIGDITAHLYTKGQPDPDLVIRTSGEQRLGGFMLWQSAHSEYYFCEAYWPAFRRVDFLRALRAYSLRERRMGK